MSDTSPPLLHVAAMQSVSSDRRDREEDWRARYGHPIVSVESFVDRQWFRGTAYKATGCLGGAATAYRPPLCPGR